MWEGSGIRYGQVKVDVRTKVRLEWQVRFLIKSSTKSRSSQSLNTECMEKMRAGACVAPRAKRNMSGSGAMILRSHTCPVKGFRRPHYEGSRASTKEQKTVAVLKVFDRTHKYQLGWSQKQLKKWLRGFTEWREAGHVGSNQNG